MGLILPEALRRRSAGIWWASLHVGHVTERNRLDFVNELLERGLDDDRLIAMFVAERVPMKELREVVAERLGWPLPTEVDAAEVVAGANFPDLSGGTSTGGRPQRICFGPEDAFFHESQKLRALWERFDAEAWDPPDRPPWRPSWEHAEEVGLAAVRRGFEAACRWPNESADRGRFEAE